MLQDIRLFSWQYALTEIIFVIRFLRSYIILDKAAILVSTLTCTSIQELPERVHGDRFLLQIALRCSPQIRLGWKPCRLAVVFFFLGFSVCESFGPRLGCYNKRMEKAYTCHDARPWKPTKRSFGFAKLYFNNLYPNMKRKWLPVSTSVFHTHGAIIPAWGSLHQPICCDSGGRSWRDNTPGTRRSWIMRQLPPSWEVARAGEGWSLMNLRTRGGGWSCLDVIFWIIC